MSGEVGWYLYAVINAADASGVDLPAGIDGAPVRAVPCADLAAVAAPVRLAGFRAARAAPDLAEDGWLALAVRAHDRVVRVVAGQTSVLPLRFGAVCATGGDVPELCGPGHPGCGRRGTGSPARPSGRCGSRRSSRNRSRGAPVPPGWRGGIESCAPATTSGGPSRRSRRRWPATSGAPGWPGRAWCAWSGTGRR